MGEPVSGKDAVDSNKATEAKRWRLLKELLDLYNEDFGRKAGQHVQPDPPPQLHKKQGKPRKRLVDESRPDFQEILAEVYEFLPRHLETGHPPRPCR
jgi:hypothetical protein